MIDDIAYDSESERNADPCTSSGCMWPKSSDGKVYVPYVIAGHYCEFVQSDMSVILLRLILRPVQLWVELQVVHY